MNEAYGVLSDPGKRARYDQLGHVGIDPTAQQYSGSAADYEDIFGRDLETLFSGLFRSSDISHGQDISVSRGITGVHCYGGDLKSPIDVYRGATHATGVDVNLGKRSMPSLRWCSHVRGQGFSLPRTCGTCRGRGTVVTIHALIAVPVEPGPRSLCGCRSPWDDRWLSPAGRWRGT